MCVHNEHISFLFARPLARIIFLVLFSLFLLCMSTLLILFYLCSFCCCCLCWWMCQAHEMIYWWISQHHCLSIFHVQMIVCVFFSLVRFGLVSFFFVRSLLRLELIFFYCALFWLLTRSTFCIYIHKYTKLDVTKQMNDFFCRWIRARGRERKQVNEQTTLKGSIPRI